MTRCSSTSLSHTDAILQASSQSDPEYSLKQIMILQLLLRHAPLFSKQKLEKIITECSKELTYEFDKRESDNVYLDYKMSEIAPLISPFPFWGMRLLPGVIDKYIAHLNNKAGVVSTLFSINSYPQFDNRYTYRLEGWRVDQFLYFHCRFLFKTLAYLNQLEEAKKKLMDSKNIEDQSTLIQELIAKRTSFPSKYTIQVIYQVLLEELFYAIELLKMHRNGEIVHRIYTNSKQKDREAVLSAYIENIFNKILQSSSYIIKSGYGEKCDENIPGHTVYVVFFRKEIDDEILYARVDNLGDESDRHLSDENGDTYPCLIEQFNLKNETDIKRLKNYLKNIFLANFERKKISSFSPLSKVKNHPLSTHVYSNNDECKDHHIHKHHAFNWKASEKQLVGNCVVKNYSIGAEMRLHGLFKATMRQEKLEAGLLYEDAVELPYVETMPVVSNPPSEKIPFPSYSPSWKI